MTGEWKVTSNLIGETKQYAVFRIRDMNAVDHSGNREYATGYMDSMEKAQEIAASMNEKREERA